MNAELLLDHYARIADAPDAIARLRRFVLDLAVRGKLVAQEEPWQTLPIESCLEKLPDGRFIHQGWSPQCEAEPSTDPMVWGVLKTTSVQDGLFLPEHNKKLPSKLDPKVKLTVRQDDILMTCAGPRARCGVPCLVGEVRERLIFSGKMYRFRAQQALIASEYLVLFLRSADTQAAMDAMKTGSSESGMNLTQDRFRTLHVTFGSLDEQRKIIATVHELMALCDQLETARTKRETARDTFTLSTLAKLNTPDPETFGQDARFALANLASLTTRPDQIKQLRRTILSLAVAGKLVDQDDADAPIAPVMEAIASPAAIRRKSRNGPTLGDGPFDIPESWIWATLGQVITYGPQNGLSPKSVHDTSAPKAITLTATTSGWFNPAHFKHVDARLEPVSEFWLQDGDLLFQRGNTREYVGMAAIYRGLPLTFIYPDLMMKVRVAESLCLPFIHLCAIAPYARGYMAEHAAGAQETMPKINQATLVALPIPLPPVAEQHRIVAKVAELMALCDGLEASITAGEQTRSRLLESVLHHALEPA